MDPSFIYSFVFGLFLGLSIAAPPGPVNAIIANESLRSNLHGTAVGAGAMTADLIFFIIVFSIRGYIPSFILKYIYIFSSILLLYLAYGVLRWEKSERSVHGNFIVGLTMGITNPYQIAWWLTVGIFMLDRYSLVSSYGFFSGILLWIIIFPLTVKRYLERFSTYVKYFSFVTLIIFAIIILYSGLTGNI
ncbi:MAG: LysE family translocator [Thermoplasmatales archaeon]|nr:LysE family translocator [Thermoplasmatales archaeon]